MSEELKNKINLRILKKALQEDKKEIKKIKIYDPDNYTVTQNKEIKEALLSFVDSCLDVLVRWKDFDETTNLIEYDNDVYNFSNSELDEAAKEILSTQFSFFDLYMEEQDKVLNHIIKEDEVEPFSFCDFIEDNELDILKSQYLADDDYVKLIEKYFANTKSLRENLC